MQAFFRSLFIGATLAILIGGASALEARADLATFSTQGTFRCQNLTPCIANGNTVIYGSGTDTVTLTFTGASGSSSGGSESFGQIQVVVSGAGASTAPFVNQAAPRVQLFIEVTQIGPVPTSRSILTDITGAIDQNSSTGYLTFNLATYQMYSAGTPGLFFIYSFDHDYLLPPPGTNGGVVNLQGYVQTIPEPATIVLLGTGLFGLAAKARKRRGSSRTPTAEH